MKFLYWFGIAFTLALIAGGLDVLLFNIYNWTYYTTASFIELSMFMLGWFSHNNWLLWKNRGNSKDVEKED